MSTNYLIGSKLYPFGHIVFRNFHYIKNILLSEFQSSSPSINHLVKSCALANQVKCDFPLVEFAEVKSLCNHPEKLLIDVRGREEFMTGKIPRSINIPFDDLDKELSKNACPNRFQKKHGRKKPDLNTYIITSCHCGDRAEEAASILKGLGYTNVHVYFGSWLNYCENLLGCK